TAAFLTFVFDDLAFTVAGGACGTGLHRTQNCLLVTDYRTAAVACRTGFRTAVTFGAAAVTVVAGDVFLEFEFLFYPGRDFFQGQSYLYAKVASAMTPLLGTAAASESAEASESASPASE